jgi:hypothetical protein
LLLSPDRQDWIAQDDIVPLVLDALSLMELSEDKEDPEVGSVGQAPVALSMLLAVLIQA